MIAVFGAEGFVLWEEDACEGITAAKRVRVFILYIHLSSPCFSYSVP